ncbi:MAG: glycosyltransferase family 4 protein [Acidimicrobiales bacterium]
MRESDSRLAVALDATPLLGFRTGVGVFCQWALDSLRRREELAVSVFAISWRRRRGIADHVPSGVRVIDTPMPARPLHRAWSMGAVPPIEWFTGSQAVVHGTNFVVPPARRAARVMTVHDLTSVRFPELCDDYTRRFPRLVRRALDEGAWVHTPSGFVAAEVVELLGAPPERVRAVHHGVPPLDLPATGPDGLPAVSGPYVLALGTVEPRKDLPTLIRAFDLVAAEEPDLRLVVAGADGWGVPAYEEAVSAAAHAGRILRLGYVDPALRSDLLRHASIYAYPSLYEGFGLPPLEAMLAGVPVVTTDAGALPEVVGDAAAMVPVGDVGAMAAALGRLLTDDSARAGLVAAGRTRAASYRWEDSAAGLSALYADAATERGSR